MALETSVFEEAGEEEDYYDENTNCIGIELDLNTFESILASPEGY